MKRTFAALMVMAILQVLTSGQTAAAKQLQPSIGRVPPELPFILDNLQTFDGHIFAIQIGNEVQNIDWVYFLKDYGKTECRVSLTGRHIKQCFSKEDNSPLEMEAMKMTKEEEKRSINDLIIAMNDSRYQEILSSSGVESPVILIQYDSSNDQTQLFAKTGDWNGFSVFVSYEKNGTGKISPVLTFPSGAKFEEQGTTISLARGKKVVAENPIPDREFNGTMVQAQINQYGIASGKKSLPNIMALSCTHNGDNDVEKGIAAKNDAHFSQYKKEYAAAKSLSEKKELNEAEDKHVLEGLDNLNKAMSIGSREDIQQHLQLAQQGSFVYFNDKSAKLVASSLHDSVFRQIEISFKPDRKTIDTVRAEKYRLNGKIVGSGSSFEMGTNVVIDQRTQKTIDSAFVSSTICTGNTGAAP